jgi:hypothetical protein
MARANRLTNAPVRPGFEGHDTPHGSPNQADYTPHLRWQQAGEGSLAVHVRWESSRARCGGTGAVPQRCLTGAAPEPASILLRAALMIDADSVQPDGLTV